MVSNFSKAFLGNRHSGCQLFLAQSILPIT